jgi:hypothetical protein
MFLSFPHNLMGHTIAACSGEQKKNNTQLICVLAEGHVATYQYIGRLEVSMDNPVTAGGKTSTVYQISIG